MYLRNHKIISNIFILGLIIVVLSGLFSFVLATSESCNSDADCSGGEKCRCDPDSADSKKEGVCGDIVICSPIKHTKIEDLIESITNWIFYIGVILVPLMFVIGAGYMITSSGDSKRVETGKNILTWTIIGLIVILFSKVFVNVIKYVLGTS